MCAAPDQHSKPLIRTGDKVLILGTATSKDQAPFDDPGFDVWAVSPYVSYPGVVSSNVDVLFEMHPERYWGHPEITERLVSFDGPVVMQDAYPQIPNAIRYPLDDIDAVFHTEAMGDDLYATNTISYMVALGVLMGYEEFHLYGVHMSHNTEYGYQKPNCEYYLGYLAALGKVVRMPAESELLKAPFLYGYKEPWADISALTHDVQQFDSDIAELERQEQELRRKRWEAEGMRKYAKMIAHVKGAY